MSDADGGRPARQAVRRWSWRLLRREWRQQVLVLSLLTFAVGAAVFGATAAYNMVSIRDADFGTAGVRFEFGVEDPEAIAPYVAAAEAWFGPVEVIGHREVTVPGAADTVELRDQAVDGRYSRPMLDVRSGRAPTESREVAITDRVAALFGAALGDEVRLGRETFTVVGMVENPADLDDEFALVAPDTIGAPEFLTMLTSGDDELVRTFRPPSQPGSGYFEARGQTEATTAAVGVYAIAAVAMVLVSLVAGAAFVTLAHRRQRQLGMLAAVGATPRHLRRAMVANGSAIGAVAGVVGTASAVVVWLLVAPGLESAAGHRIDRFDVPLWVPVVGAAPRGRSPRRRPRGGRPERCRGCRSPMPSRPDRPNPAPRGGP